MSLAELNSRVMNSLGLVSDYIDLAQVHNAVVQRVNVRTMQARHSSTNVLLATTDEFAVDSIPYDITSLIGKSTPAWLEMRWIQTNPATFWQQVRIVPLSQLGDYQAMGTLAAAFHGEEPANDASQATQYLSFTYLPQSLCRIRFDRDSQRLALDGEMLLPDNLSDLIVREAQNDVIPHIRLAIRMAMRRDSVLRQDGNAIIQELNGIVAQNMLVLTDLIALWKVWAYTDRAKETNFNNPNPRGASLYGDSRWGGGFTGSGY